MGVDFGQLAEEVLRRCRQLASYSEEAGCLTRTFLSPPMHEVHAALGDWMKPLGMTTRIDGLGNFVGRKPGGGDAHVLLLGSHLDTVPNSGWYDGMLGVLVAVAAMDALRDTALPFAVDVIGFSEEEGVRFAKPYLGSRAIAGSFDQKLLARLDAKYCSLHQAICDFGLDPIQIPSAAYPPEQVIGYVEPHLEQGPVLEQLGLPVGVVNGIVGQCRALVRFVGMAGHAGTTPMPGRRDALVAAAEWIQAVSLYGQTREDLRATVGAVRVEPNAPNVIPGAVELSLDVRHSNDDILQQAVDDLLQAGKTIATEHELGCEVLDCQGQSSTPVDQRLTGHLAKAIETCGYQVHRLPSGAGHDAVVMAEQFPMAMLFIRHPGGVSHHPDERVETADVAVAIRVLAKLIERLAYEQIAPRRRNEA